MALSRSVEAWQNDVNALADRLVQQGWAPFQALAEATRRISQQRARAARRQLKTRSQ